MRLTRRGERVVVALIIIASLAMLVGAAWLGQEWKSERLRSEYRTDCQENRSC